MWWIRVKAKYSQLFSISQAKMLYIQKHGKAGTQRERLPKVKTSQEIEYLQVKKILKLKNSCTEKENTA